MADDEKGAAVVIGAGIAGLATAALLGAEGWDVTVLEARDELGGRVGSWEQDGFRFDTGPSWYLMPEVFEHFFRLLGTTAERELDLVPLDPAYRVYSQPNPDRPLPPTDVQSGRAEATRAVRGDRAGRGREARRLPRLGGRCVRALGDPLSVRHVREHRRAARSRAPAPRRPARPSADPVAREPCRSAVHRSPAATDPRLPGRVPRRFALRRSEPLPPHESPRPRRRRAVPPRRFHRDHRRGQAPGHRPRRGHPTPACEVVEITTTDAVATGVRLSDGRRIAADLVVSTADLHHTETALLPPALQTYPEKWWAKRTPSPGALLLLLGVEGELPQLAHHTLLFAEDWRANFEDIFDEPSRIPDPASLYICKPSATDTHVAPPGHENLFVLVPIPGRSADRTRRGGRRRRRCRRDRRRSRDPADLRVVRHPRSRRAHRRAAHDLPRRLRGRPALVARQRARPGAHARSERRVPAAQRLAQGAGALVRRRIRAARASGCRCA